MKEKTKRSKNSKTIGKSSISLRMYAKEDESEKKNNEK